VIENTYENRPSEVREFRMNQKILSRNSRDDVQTLVWTRNIEIANIPRG